MSMQAAEFEKSITNIIVELAKLPDIAIDTNTPLFGESRILDSMSLVELCLRLEELASDHGFEFDWASETAMSRSRSMFRTVGSLTKAFLEQAAEQQAS